jgi:hypothetical protein
MGTGSSILDGIKSIFSGGSESSGLAPTSLTNFFGGTGNILGGDGGIGGLGTYEKLGSSTPFASISDLGGYQNDMGSIISGNQDYLKDIISGTSGTDWGKIAASLSSLGKGISANGATQQTTQPTQTAIQMPQMTQMNPMAQVNIGQGSLPPRSQGAPTKFASIPAVELLKAVAIINARRRGEI